MAKKPTPPPAAASEPADEIPESEIRAKVIAGLTPEQAVEVITRQRQHDAAE